VKLSTSGLLFVVISTLTGVAGQLFLKRGTLSTAVALDLSHPIQTFVSLITNGYILGWIAMAVISTLTWVLVVSKFELSYAYPVVMTVSFVLILVLSQWLFGETLTATRLIGVALMIAGIIVASK